MKNIADDLVIECDEIIGTVAIFQCHPKTLSSQTRFEVFDRKGKLIIFDGAYITQK